MKLNFDYYKENDTYELKRKEKDFEGTIKELENIRKNLVYSYDFKQNSNILEIGAIVGAITEALCEKNEKVISIAFGQEEAETIAKKCENKENLEIIVGKLQDIKLEEKFDYITLIGVLEYAQHIFCGEKPAEELLKYCVNLLKPNGKILIATDNKFALKSYVGDLDECTGNTFDSITGYKSSPKGYKLGKNKIEEILKNVGLNYYKFLYPLPNYKLPSLIFSDEYLPTSSKINGYFPCYHKESSIFFSEVDAYDTIIKEDNKMFPFFANSYFIEASQVEFKNDTKYVSFNNYRKEEYQLMTKIKEKTVEKTYINEKSKIHLENMIENIKKLKEANIEILDYEQEGKVISKFVEGKLASQVISDNTQNPEKIFEILNQYKETINKIAIPYQEEKQTVLEKYIPDIDKEILKEFHYLENGYWDMILKNCFIIENKCVFFDQEWVEENVPVEFLIYRSIVNIEKLRNKIEEYEIYEKMGIKKYISIFEELDRKITENIMDKQLFEFYTRKYDNPIYENYVLKGDINNLTRDKTELEKSKKQLETEIYGYKDKISKLNNELKDIYQSKTWKVAKKLADIKHTFTK